MLGKYLNPQNEVAFKRIFGQEKNKDILLALLNTVLKTQIHRPIQEAHLIPRVQDPETLAKKTSVLDLMCKDQDGCMYIIEMQVANSEGFKERA
ncbi:MAG: Rpn family recombination-promoting nuclease/putative transposase, partial [Bacteroidota bacterium]